MPKTLLYIDDDQDDLEIFVDAVQSLNLNYECQVAVGGLNAFSMLQSFLPDFIFLDINMPGMNGREVLGHLRRNQQLHKVPIIILSTSIVEQDVTELIGNGANACLTKPNQFRTLCELLEKILKE